MTSALPISKKPINELTYQIILHVNTLSLIKLNQRFYHEILFETFIENFTF